MKACHSTISYKNYGDQTLQNDEHIFPNDLGCLGSKKMTGCEIRVPGTMEYTRSIFFIEYRCGHIRMEPMRVVHYY